MSNRFWTDKTDGVDDIVAEDFNSAFDGIVTDVDKKAEKSDIFSSRGVGVQIGENSKASNGVSIGYNAQSGQYTVAIGNDAKGDGVSIGSSAKCYDGTKYINAIQLGTGTNNNENTLQVYDYQLMDASGNIPVERLTELKKLSVPHTTASGYHVSVSDHLEGESVIDYKVYGNSVQETRSGKNLLTYPYYDTTKTVNGITFTDNGDGTITVNGTATDSAYYILKASNWDAELPLSAGTYTLSGCPSGGSISTFVLIMSGRTSEDDPRKQYIADIGQGKTANLRDGRYDFVIGVYAGATLSNVVFKPQLELGTTATSYEQYGAMPSPDFPSEIKSTGDLVTDTSSPYYGKYDVPVTVCGKNLIPYPYKETTKTENGLTWTDNGDGTITASGTSTGYSAYIITYKKSIISSNTKYCFSGIDSTTNITLVVMLYNENGTQLASLETTSSKKTLVFDTTDYPTATKITLQVKRTDNTNTSGTIKPQLEIGSAATSYEPYSGETKHIYIDEPLRKKDTVADYFYYKNQEVVRQIEVLDSTGTKTIDESFGLLATPTTEPITAPDFDVPISEGMNISSSTVTPPSSMDVTYYQDINKVITELKNAILAQGGNV